MIPKLKTILLTGASGFLGGHIKAHLEKSGGWRVRTIVDRQAFRNFEEFPQISSLDVLIHSGFSVDFTPACSQRKLDLNVENTIKVIDYAKKMGVSYVVFLSAAGVMGVSKSSQSLDESRFGKTDSEYVHYLNTQYIQSKIACRTIMEDLPMPSSTLYLTTVYGSGMDRTVVNNLKSVCGFNPFILVPPGGSSFLDLRDFLSGLDTVLENRPSDELILSSGNFTFEKLYQTVIDFYGVSWRKRTLCLPRMAQHLMEIGIVNKLAGGGASAVLKSGFGYKYYSPHKVLRILGWKPKYGLIDSLKVILSNRLPSG
jgi:nucleoside-diphosphate-sugar epimerase